MDKIAMYKEQIEKLALNAMKAREMAKKVGLLPEGQWKWALRNMRGKKGELLKGRELAEAKKKMGSMDNQTKNVIQRMGDQAGRQEISASLAKGEKVRASSMTNKMSNPETIANIEAGRRYDISKSKNVEWYQLPKKDKFVKGELSSYPDPETIVTNSPSLIGKDIERRIHTHPKWPKNYKGGTVGNNAEFSGGKWLNRIGDKSKSDKRNNTDNILDLAFRRKLSGSDVNMAAQDLISRQNLNKVRGPRDVVYNNIPDVVYSPHNKIEGVHKLRPQGLRSTYFDRSPRKSRT